MKQFSTPETFWAQLRESQALRRHLDKKVSSMPLPNFSAIFSSGYGVRPRQIRFAPLAVALSLTASACVLGFLLFVASGNSAPQLLSSQTGVAEQVFRSTSQWDTLATEPQQGNQQVFSSVLKTIDAGITRWDDQPSLEE